MSSKYSFCLKTGLLCSALFVSTYHSVSADVMSNPELQLDTSASAPVSTSTFDDQKTISEGANSDHTPSITSRGKIGVTLSTPFIDFGNIMPGEPILRELTVKVNSQDIRYSILAYEDQALSAPDGSFIPETSCDNGSCNPQLPAAWTSPLTFGFGYRCDSVMPMCIADFSSPDQYKAFAKGSNNAQQIISTSANDTTANLTLKLNVSGSQSRTTYHNTITLIFLPQL